MLTIPITDNFAQSLTVQLAGQSCRIDLKQKSTGLYCDLYVSDVLILAGVLCLNLVRIVRSLHFGFVGDLVFQDTQGATDPASPGLGSRYLLCYLEAADVAALA